MANDESPLPGCAIDAKPLPKALPPVAAPLRLPNPDAPVDEPRADDGLVGAKGEPGVAVDEPRTVVGLVGANGDPGAGPGLSVAPNGLEVALDETSPKDESVGFAVANGLGAEELPIVPKGDAEFEASLPNPDAANAEVDV